MMLDFQPTILKGCRIQLESLNESHKNELYDAAQDQAIWTYNSSKAFGKKFYRWFDKAIKFFQHHQHLPFIVRRIADKKLLVAHVTMILILSIID